MNKHTLLIILFVFNILFVLTGAYFKITHQSFGYQLFVASFVLMLAFVALALSEVYRSQRINTSQKLMWTVGLLFFHTIAALVYLLVGRKYVVNEVFLR